MQRVYVTKRFTFEAAHYLPNYNGACSDLHGHSYKLEVTVSGEPNKSKTSDKYGMVIDFKELKMLVYDNALIMLDHRDLNKVYKYPTAEFMVIDLYKRISEALPNHLNLESVKLWETEDSYAEYRGEN